MFLLLLLFLSSLKYMYIEQYCSHVHVLARFEFFCSRPWLTKKTTEVKMCTAITSEMHTNTDYHQPLIINGLKRINVTRKKNWFKQVTGLTRTPHRTSAPLTWDGVTVMCAWFFFVSFFLFIRSDFEK